MTTTVPWRNSIHTRAAVIVGGIVFLVGALTAIAQYLSARDALGDMARVRLTEVALTRADLIELFIGQQYDRITLVASRTRLGKLVTDLADGVISPSEFDDRALAILIDARESTHGLEEIWVVNRSGLVVVATNPALLGTSFTDDEAYAMGLERPYFDRPRHDGERFYGVVAAPIERDGRRLGVTMARVEIGPVIRTTNVPAGHKKSFDVVISRRAGDDIEHLFPVGLSNPREQYRRIDAPLLAAIEGHHGFARVEHGRGDPIIAAYQPVGAEGWGLVVSMPVAKAYAPISGLAHRAMVFGVIILTAALAGSLVFSYRFTRPIFQIATAASRIAEGDLAARAEVHSRDELGTLGASFNQMAVALEHRSEELERSNRELSFQKYALDQHAIVAITDSRGRITYVNDLFCEISKYSRRELLGQDHRIINSGYHSKSFFKGMYATIAAGKVWSGEIRNRAKDGSIYWVDTTIVPAVDAGGKITRYVAIRADITDQKRVEDEIKRANAELEHKNHEMEQFVYTASHDLKSPLVTVQGFVAHLIRDVKANRTDRLLTFCKRISDGVSRMRGSIDELLELSRIGRVMNEPEWVDVNTVVRDVIADHQTEISQRAIEVVIQPDLPRVFADAPRLVQVFDNLIGNALKYGCPAEKPVIEIGGDADAREVRLWVADNGPGVPEAYRDRVFRLFERLDNSHDGTGIGLAIVQRVVTVHGGRVWIDPEAAQGARFVVAFPKQGAVPHPTESEHSLVR